MDIGHIEQMIRKLNGVVSCKIIEADGLIREVHVLTNLSRHPKQVSRDIQSVFIASGITDIDRKCISIAQLDIEETSISAGRVQIEEIKYNVSSDTYAEASVSLSIADMTYCGTVSGINTQRNSERMIVEATLNSIHEIFGSQARLVLEDISSVNIANQKVYNVAICSLNNQKEELHIGSALVSGDSRSALVKATLDALNRRMNILLK